MAGQGEERASTRPHLSTAGSCTSLMCAFQRAISSSSNRTQLPLPKWSYPLMHVLHL